MDSTSTFFLTRRRKLHKEKSTEYDPDDIQCPGCLGYTNEPLVEFCEECAEKAASYDTLFRDRTHLARAIKEVIKLTDGEIRGLLRAALACCALKE